MVGCPIKIYPLQMREVFLKKSFDYFKTLKILSESVSVIYSKALLNQDFSSERIQFFAEKSELINNLQNEFITPLERGDIFLLEENLVEELNSVFTMQNYFAVINIDEFVELRGLEKVLKNQNNIFSQLSGFKSNLKLFEQCSEEISRLNTEKKNTEKKIVDSLKCKTEQPLVKYAVYSALLDLNRKIYKTVLEIERILINNS